MKTFKNWLLRVSPTLYFYCRDRFQFTKRLLSGEVSTMVKESNEIDTFEQAFNFTNKHIKSYQIESEIKSLVAFLQDAKPKNYLEIGTADGGTHFLIRKLCGSIQMSIAIDTDIRNKYLIDRITSTASSHYITGYSNHVDTLNAARRLITEEGTLDALFIDGDHSYDGVKADFTLYQSLVRKGGCIIFHDIVQDWNQRYGRETNKYTGGVPQFFAEIKDQYQHHLFVESLDQDGFGIGVIIQN